MNYYVDFPEYVSNSDLGALKKALRAEAEMPGLQKIYDFGNLVDAMKTEKEKVNLQDSTLTEGQRVIKFAQDEMERATLMTRALDADPLLSLAFANCLFQYVVMRKQFKIEYDGHEIVIPARCKYDGFIRKQLAIDIKTTACTTQEQFEAAFDFFDYDRQGAWYMDLGQVDRMLYVGVSKKPNKRTGKYDVFKIAIVRGDARYNSGKAKYSKLAYKWSTLIAPLDEKLLKINI